MHVSVPVHVWIATSLILAPIPDLAPLPSGLLKFIIAVVILIVVAINGG